MYDLLQTTLQGGLLIVYCIVQVIVIALIFVLVEVGVEVIIIEIEDGGLTGCFTHILHHPAQFPFCILDIRRTIAAFKDK